MWLVLIVQQQPSQHKQVKTLFSFNVTNSICVVLANVAKTSKANVTSRHVYAKTFSNLNVTNSICVLLAKVSKTSEATIDITDVFEKTFSI